MPIALAQFFWIKSKIGINLIAMSFFGQSKPTMAIVFLYLVL